MATIKVSVCAKIVNKEHEYIGIFEKERRYVIAFSDYSILVIV
jgi:hypothetical protein